MDLNTLTKTPDQPNLKLVAVKLPVELIDAMRRIRSATGKTNTEVYAALLKEGVSAFKAATGRSGKKPGRKPGKTKAVKTKAKPKAKAKIKKVKKVKAKIKAKTNGASNGTGKRRGRPPKIASNLPSFPVPPAIEFDADLE